VKVVKYSGSGYDFVIFVAQEKSDRSALAKELCNRHDGVGADGMVVVVPHEEYDFEWEFYNADGSYAAMCGNASRCVAHFAVELGISSAMQCNFLTGAGVIRAEVNGNYVKSDMVEPQIKFKQKDYKGEKLWLIDSGVPHIVAYRENIEEFALSWAKEVREEFDANVNICTIDNGVLRVRTYERGVEDETLACGTGMVACYIRLHQEGRLSGQVEVRPRSNEELYVEYNNDKYSFAGMIKKIFSAEVYIGESI